MPGGSRGCVSIKYAQHHCPLTGSCAGLDLHTAGLFFPSFCLPRHLVRRVLCVWREDFFAIFVARMGIQFNTSPRQTRSEIFSRQGTLLTRSERADRDPFARIGTFKKARGKNLLNFGVRDSWRTLFVSAIPGSSAIRVSGYERFFQMTGK